MPIFTITEDGSDPVVVTTLSDPTDESSENLVASSPSCCCGYLACHVICCSHEGCGGCGDNAGQYGPSSCCEGDDCCGFNWKTREGGCTVKKNGAAILRPGDPGASGQGKFINHSGVPDDIEEHPEQCEGFSWSLANDSCPEAFVEEVLASLP